VCAFKLELIALLFQSSEPAKTAIQLERLKNKARIKTTKLILHKKKFPDLPFQYNEALNIIFVLFLKAY